MSKINCTSLTTAIGLAAFLAGCGTTEGEFPSLARRPYEIAGPNKAVVVAPPAAPVALPPDLAASVAAIGKRHDTAEAAFQKALPSVRGLASRSAGTAAGSEAWVNAHLELSRLDKARADSVAALGEFDGLIADQIEADSAYVAFLVDAQQRIATEVAAQRAEIDRLSRQIGE